MGEQHAHRIIEQIFIGAELFTLQSHRIAKHHNNHMLMQLLLPQRTVRQSKVLTASHWNVTDDEV